MKKFLISIALVALASSCIYPYDPDLGEKDLDDIMVIEGNIIIGGTSTVRLNQVMPIVNESTSWYGSYRDISGTAVIEDDEGQLYHPVQTRKATVFTFNSTEQAKPDRKYRLKVTVGNNVYMSDWVEPVTPPTIEEVSFSCDESNVQVEVTLEGGEDASGYVGITYDETWEFHADFTCDYLLDTVRWTLIDAIKTQQEYPNYWCWQSTSSYNMILLDISEFEGGRAVKAPLFTFLRTNSRNHRKYSVNLHARTLPKEAYRYLKNMDDITTSGRSLFTPNPGEMASNISCETDPSARVLGYVNVMRETSFRGWMDDRFKKNKPAYYGEFKLPQSDPVSFMAFYYGEGYYPVKEMSMPDPMTGEPVEGIYWAPRRCVDCVLMGGTKKKPDFWE